MENKDEIIHTIKKIQHIEEECQIDDELKLILTGSAFLTGALGICAFSNAYMTGEVLSGISIMTGVASIPLILALTIFIKEKVSTLIAVNKVRKEEGLTKELQREVLEELVAEGDPTGIKLFNYFYGEEKGKSL